MKNMDTNTDHFTPLVLSLYPSRAAVRGITIFSNISLYPSVVYGLPCLLLEKWFPLQGERAHELIPCIFEFSKRTTKTDLSISSRL